MNRKVENEKREHMKVYLMEVVKPLTVNMESRGGGVKDILLYDHSEEVSEVYEIQVTFETADSMGANFINSCLEEMSKALENFVMENSALNRDGFEIVMAILSNYTPECVVECKVECPADQLAAMSPDKAGWKLNN